MKIEREEFIEVTNELVQILLTTSEKEDLDFKRVGKVRNVFKTAVAMANGNKRMPLTNNTLDKLLLAIEGIKKD